MNLKIKHIVLILVSIILSACAMENRSVKSSDETYEMAAEELDIEVVSNYEVIPTFNAPLINQKLQDFYDLIALQNQHPEFTEEVTEQLKNYTNDSLSNFKTKNVAIIENVKQIGKIIHLNDSTKKIKLTYNKVVDNTKIADTIFAIINNKIIKIDGEPIVSKKVRFSKN
ncbi:hypothetical protein [uncultured Winogradskyella sp.]|uniref:hypothetical protein n=1 Tax=uncultured Winogradskyella sp. TaxID=395353 RepID=UPI002609ED21|nr:hypothetical protein [uncultured Winogradskyella sp.]